MFCFSTIGSILRILNNKRKREVETKSTHLATKDSSLTPLSNDHIRPLIFERESR